MPVRIRLSRIGKKKVPYYRIVAVDGRKKRDGKCLQDLGTYDGINSRLIRFDQEGVDKWISLGAQPSESALKVIKLYKRNGVVSGSVKKTVAEQPKPVKEIAKKAAEPKKEATPAKTEKPAKAEAAPEEKKAADKK